MKNQIIYPLCSIVILSYNKQNFTKICLESIRKYTHLSYEIIVVDNNSSEEGCLKYLLQQKDIILIQNKENKGFAGGCNQGITAAKGKYIMLLNNDTIVTNNWLSNMVDLLEQHPEIAMTGPLTNATVGKQQIPVSYGDDLEKMQEFAYKISISSAKPWKTLRLVFFCTLIRRELFQEIGLLDENFVVGNYEDDDFNLRLLTSNKKMYICRNSFVHHYMNVSFKDKNIQREKIMQKNKLYLEYKWNQMDWNHHAAFNQYMLDQILNHKGKNVLHIGCGLGALAIELKDFSSDYFVVGVEEHDLRKNIAETFLDKVYSLDYSYEFLDMLPVNKFDVIIIENSIEILGLNLLKKIKSFVETTSLILVRVFNSRHITTIEKAVFGKVEGNLLCASSCEFHYQFDSSITNYFLELGYKIDETKEIKKTLSSTQQELYELLNTYESYSKDAEIYNRIYKLSAEKS